VHKPLLTFAQRKPETLTNGGISPCPFKRGATGEGGAFP